MGIFSRFKKGLQKGAQAVQGALSAVTGRGSLDEEGLLRIEEAFYESDFGVEATEEIMDSIREAHRSEKELRGEDAGKIARTVVERFLQGSEALFNLEPSKAPEVLCLIGVNGSGKTTTCAKLAHRLEKQGSKVVLGACDTFRAAAIEQLNLWGNRLDIPVVRSEYGADPASVAHDAVNSALSKGSDYLFIDTAGRLHTKHNLMRELEKLHRVISTKSKGAPHETLLVVDASVGSNALSQAREFNKSVPLTGLVITKLDGTSKGGMVVAIQNELDLPVKFIGLGEQADDLQPFSPTEYARALFFEE